MVGAHYKSNDEPDWSQEKAESEAAASASAFVTHYHAASYAKRKPDQQQKRQNFHELPPAQHRKHH
jgi:hypothetical protein